MAIYSKNDEIIDFSDTSESFCGSYSNCKTYSHNGLTFIVGEVTTGNVS